VSGVVLAVILGGGIALARAFHGFGLGNLAVLTLVLGFTSFCWIFGEWLRRRRGQPGLAATARRMHLPGWLGWAGPMFAFVFFAVLILTWIGVAAGFK
jgi:hypothetical protein